MKKMLIIATLIISCLTIKVDALGMGFNKYKSLDISHAFLVGEYMFDLDHGYSPTLQDFMIAARSIDEGETTKAYEILMDAEDEDDIYFKFTDLYRNTTSNDTSSLDNIDIKYVYRSNIKNATKTDFDLID